jgi:hypothetical protein
MEIAFFTQHMMVMGDFFLNGYKKEYPNCKFPTFNSGKTIERQVERGLYKQYFLMRPEKIVLMYIISARTPERKML